MRLAAALIETTYQLLILASLHLQPTDHFPITHRVLVELTHAEELTNINSSTNYVNLHSIKRSMLDNIISDCLCVSVVFFVSSVGCVIVWATKIFR